MTQYESCLLCVTSVINGQKQATSHFRAFLHYPTRYQSWTPDNGIKKYNIRIMCQRENRSSWRPVTLVLNNIIISGTAIFKALIWPFIVGLVYRNILPWQSIKHWHKLSHLKYYWEYLDRTRRLPRRRLSLVGVWWLFRMSYNNCIVGN